MMSYKGMFFSKVNGRCYGYYRFHLYLGRVPMKTMTVYGALSLLFIVLLSCPGMAKTIYVDSTAPAESLGHVVPGDHVVRDVR